MTTPLPTTHADYQSNDEKDVEIASKNDLKGSNHSFSAENNEHNYGGNVSNDVEYNANGVDKFQSRRDGLEEDDTPVSGFMLRLRSWMHSKSAIVLRDFGLIALLLGWWIPAIINDNHVVRHRWIPSTVIVWFFILLILLHNSKYIPQRPFVVVLVKIWSVVAVPWSKLPHIGKLALGWFALAILVFGTTYGLPVTPTSGYVDRTRSLAGLVIIYLAQFARSHNHKAIQARTAILGIGFQFIIALFVFRTGAGYSLFGWIATAAADLLTQAQVGGAAFFWSSAFIKNYYFMVNTLSSIIFFVALSVALFYCGILSWVIRKFAWFFYKTFGISGAEAVVAVASPFIGQGENVILIKPFALGFSRSEFHQVLTSGFATISGSLLNTYIYLGVPGTVLVSSSVMSIPAAIAASKMVYPETQEVESAGTVSVTSAEQMQDGSSGTLHAFSKGAWFGVKVAGLIFANVLVLLSLVYVINGILAYIGNAWYITDANRGPLSLELIIGYVLWPLTYMLGVPKVDVLRVSKLIATKIVANEFVAYTALNVIETSDDPLTRRGFLIASYTLCGFGNISSLGINVGVMSAIAPKRAKDIIKLAPSALITGILVTLSSAAVAGIVID